MPQWISGFERVPSKHGLYFVKCNGEKKVVRLYEFDRHLELYDTFLWLDESDYVAEVKKELIGINDIDTFSQFNRHDLSEMLLTPYEPRIGRSVITNAFHKYYLRIIAQLRVELSSVSKNKNFIYKPSVNNHQPKIEKTKADLPIEKKTEPKPDSLLDKIKLLNTNFYAIEKDKN